MITRDHKAAEAISHIQELVESIIDCLANSPKELRACAFVSHAWLPRAQLLLLAHLDVSSLREPYDGHNITALQRLCAVVPTSPHLSEYIRHLTISTDPDVFALLASFPLPRLEKLTLHCLKSQMKHRSTTMPAIQRILTLLSLRKVEFFGYFESAAVLGSYFMNCSPDVTMVQLAGIGSDGFRDDQVKKRKVNSSVGPASPRIVPFHVSLNNSLMPWLTGAQCPFKWSRLRSLTLHATAFRRIESSESALTRALGFIERLEITSLMNFDLDSLVRCLAGMHALTTLRLSVPQSSLLMLSAVLQRLPPSMASHLYTLQLSLNTFRTDDEWLDMVRKFDEEAVMLPALAGLRRVEVALTSNQAWQTSSVALEALRTCFLHLGAAKKVLLSRVDNDDDEYAS